MAQQTKGCCKYCGKEYAKGGMLRHLQSCKARKEKSDAESGGKKCGYFELVLSGKYDSDYWLIIEIKETATLEDLDEFIRDIWVECCGHLSAFTIAGEEYESDPDTDSFWGNSEDMNHKLKDVLSVGEKIEYEYDFGSTTELVIKVQDYRKGCGKADTITILSRNHPVKHLCSQCKKNEAKWIDQEAYYEENPFWCEECLDREFPEGDDGGLMLLPICNSPRMGVCDYEGSEKYGEQFVPDTEKTEKDQFSLVTDTFAVKKTSGSVSDDGEKKKSYRVLVVVDMQNDFLTGSLGNADCKAVIPPVVKVIAEGGYDQVILTRDTHGEDYPTTQEGRKLPVVHTIKDTEGWQIEKTVMDAVNEHYSKEQITLIDKPGFGSEKLADRIRELGKKYPGDRELTVAFVGVCTDICVISNVFLAKAAAPNAEIRVIERACAGVTEESHHTAIEAMRGCQVDIV